jgi:hypothetical protein
MVEKHELITAFTGDCVAVLEKRWGRASANILTEIVNGIEKDYGFLGFHYN